MSGLASEFCWSAARMPICRSILRYRVATWILSSLLAGASAHGQVVFSEDFDGGALPAEISGAGAIEGVQSYAGLGPAGGTFEGSFLRNTTNPPSATVLTLSGLPPHNTVNLRFLLAVIDSWDGDGSVTTFRPDFLIVRVDGAEIFNESFLNSTSAGVQTYSPAPGAVIKSPDEAPSDLGFNTGALDHHDAAYDFALEPAFQGIPHSDSTLTVEWTAAGSGWQGGTDESWAIENLEVELDGPQTVLQLFERRDSFATIPDTVPANAVTYARRRVRWECPAGHSTFLSGSPDGLQGLIADNFLAVDGSNVCQGGYVDPPGFVNCFANPDPNLVGVPVEDFLDPVPPLDLSALIPSGSSESLIELRDFGTPAGNTEIYLVTDCTATIAAPVPSLGRFGLAAAAASLVLAGMVGSVRRRASRPVW